MHRLSLSFGIRKPLRQRWRVHGFTNNINKRNQCSNPVSNEHVFYLFEYFHFHVILVHPDPNNFPNYQLNFKIRLQYPNNNLCLRLHRPSVLIRICKHLWQWRIDSHTDHDLFKQYDGGYIDHDEHVEFSYLHYILFLQLCLIAFPYYNICLRLHRSSVSFRIREPLWQWRIDSHTGNCLFKRNKRDGVDNIKLLKSSYPYDITFSYHNVRLWLYRLSVSLRIRESLRQ